MINVYKIGGNVIDNAEALDAFLKDFAQLPSPKVLIHGGGKLATRLSGRLGIETHMVDGRRITDRETLDVVTMVYGGLVNKQIVAKLQALGCNAIGLTGADANVIPATRRKPNPIDYGYVGDIDTARINVSFIQTLLEAGITPVFCALCHEDGSMLNCNADTIAQSVATAMATVGETRLTFCFEQLGVMGNLDDPSSLIPTITPELYAALKADGTINSGMIPKIDNAYRAIENGVQCVTIKHSKNIGNEVGTTICN